MKFYAKFLHKGRHRPPKVQFFKTLFKPMFKNLCRKFCIYLKAFCQQKLSFYLKAAVFRDKGRAVVMRPVKIYF